MGIPEEEREDTDQIVVDVATSMGVYLSPDFIEISHRIPKFTSKPQKQQRPIIVRLVSNADNRHLFKSRPKLKDARPPNSPKIFINKDLNKTRANIARQAIMLVAERIIESSCVTEGVILIKKVSNISQFQKVCELTRLKITINLSQEGATPLVCMAACNYPDEEHLLLSKLRHNYNIEHRPNKTTTVQLCIVVSSLTKLDISLELMSLSGIVCSLWKDPRLVWKPSDYSNITELVIPINYIWKPSLIIENEIRNVGMLGYEGAPLRVLHDGAVELSLPVTTTTSCAVDITYFPYDTQTCTLVLSVWSYKVNEVDLVTDPKTPVTTKFNTNGEWDLLGTDLEPVITTSGGNSHRNIYFKLTFRRKWQFYRQNIIIPVVLNSLLMAMVIAVPIEERTSYCLTVLLSYIVLLTMVSENLPSISSQPSITQIYVSVMMCLGTLGTLCTIAVRRLYNEDEEKPVPVWLQTFTKYFLAPVTCITCKKTRVSSPCDNDLAGSTTMEHVYGFKDIAKMVDTVLFRVFAFLILLTTLGFLVVVNRNY